jgi:alpha-L-fucosidase 2
MLMKHRLSAILSITGLLLVSMLYVQAASLDDYNVVWDTPSADSAGSMPLGNGEIALNAWVEPSGDLLFYIARTDAWSGSINDPFYGAYGLIKVGRVRVSLSPNPFANATGFRQELKLRDGAFEASAGPDGKKSRLRLWVDANRPVVQVEYGCAKPVSMKVAMESWRTAPTQWLGADTIVSGQKDRVVWYYKSKNTDIQQLVNRTIGAAIQGEGLVSAGDTALQSAKPLTVQRVSIHPLTAQCATRDEWISKLDAQIAATTTTTTDKAWKEHRAWWQSFWDRSHVFITAGEKSREVTSGYILQRFKNACAGRGAHPIKFNGSLFNVDNPEPKMVKIGDKDVPMPITADFRVWGHQYWFQNTRPIYWPMMASGDFDLMQPLFRMYAGQIQENLKRCREFYGHDGAYFVETGPFWSWMGKTSPEDPADYTRHYYTPVLELSAMMLDYFAYTQDREFAKNTLLPMAEAGVTFYDQHFKRDSNGKLFVSPANSVETFWKVDGPTPDIAGLTWVLQGLLALPNDLTADASRNQWRRLLGELPEIPVGDRDGTRIILPHHGPAIKASNCENPELYAVYPFRLYGLGKPDLELARETFNARKQRMMGCWSQEAVQAAYLGDSLTARKYVTSHLTRKDKRMRFPAFWEAGFDYIPDEDNGGNGLHALQTMLVQFDGPKILLLPAWPKKWDADFKLRAPQQTTVEGVVRDGKLVSFKVTPESRRKDVVVMEPSDSGLAGLIEPAMKATASNSYGGEYESASAIDGDPQTRWASMANQGWLEVDLGKPMTFNSALISEAFSPRVQSFELQAKQGEAWRTFYQGSTLSVNFRASFAPVTAQHVRLNVLQASEGPTIWEFQLMAK